MQQSPSNGGFVREAGARLIAHWLTKTIGLSLGMTAFFAVYFWLLNHPIFPVRAMPLTAVDRFVGFHPGTLPLYVSLWVYILLPFVLLKDPRELLSYGIAAGALSAIGFGIFLLWPTAVPSPGIEWAPHSPFSYLKAVDASGNACPSLHVAFSVFTAVRLGRLLRELRAPVFVRAGSWMWCLGIVYSSLATGQHVAIDALAGTLLGAIVAAVSKSPARETAPAPGPSGLAESASRSEAAPARPKA